MLFLLLFLPPKEDELNEGRNEKSCCERKKMEEKDSLDLLLESHAEILDSIQTEEQQEKEINGIPKFICHKNNNAR